MLSCGYHFGSKIPCVMFHPVWDDAQKMTNVFNWHNKPSVKLFALPGLMAQAARCVPNPFLGTSK